ncbi:MAG: DUF3168 domain-containing protein [Thioclava sp.]|nr:DUF3168 domain-containing protein [Thioclava sp.]MBD3803561.1 DUF3168 domain-containing protein [Thioclava sp.]
MEAEFQAAVYERLTFDPFLEAEGVTVYDTRPQGEDGIADSNLPAIEVGEIDARDWGTKTDDGLDLILRVHSFMSGGSKADLRALQTLIFKALHKKQAELSMTGGHVVLIRRESSRVLPDKAPLHGVCEYRALVEISGG